MIAALKRSIKAAMRFIVPRFYFMESGTLIIWLDREFYFG